MTDLDKNDSMNNSDESQIDTQVDKQQVKNNFYVKSPELITMQWVNGLTLSKYIAQCFLLFISISTLILFFVFLYFMRQDEIQLIGKISNYTVADLSCVIVTIILIGKVIYNLYSSSMRSFRFKLILFNNSINKMWENYMDALFYFGIITTPIVFLQLWDNKNYGIFSDYLFISIEIVWIINIYRAFIYCKKGNLT